jgi:FtsH-binding integral membrane protein
MRYAVEHNHDIRISQLTQDSRRAEHTEAIGAFLPAISGNIGMFWAVYGLSIAVSLITSVIVIFVIAFDSQQLKRAIASGEIDQYPHLEVFFAFHMYVDFINLFLRVLRVLLVLKNRN